MAQLRKTTLTAKGAFLSPIGMISRSEITAVSGRCRTAPVISHASPWLPMAEGGLSVMDKDIMGLAEG
ncbi:MAG TPA: hypothetical protein DEB63_12270 [Agrobacterium sp.]|nr:hypothetical protein [Agrobacterium sp.]